MSDGGFFLAGRAYLFHGYVHTVHSVVECAYGWIAFTTFDRRGITDVQILIEPQFGEAQLLPLEAE